MEKGQGQGHYVYLGMKPNNLNRNHLEVRLEVVFLKVGIMRTAKETFTRRSENYSSEPLLVKSGGIDFLVFEDGKPIFETVSGSPFQQWAVMCPHTEAAKKGNEYLNGLENKWKEILKKMRKEN